jgi:hypothetical protein
MEGISSMNEITDEFVQEMLSKDQKLHYCNLKPHRQNQRKRG